MIRFGPIGRNMIVWTFTTHIERYPIYCPLRRMVFTSHDYGHVRCKTITSTIPEIRYCTPRDLAFSFTCLTFAAWQSYRRTKLPSLMNDQHPDGGLVAARTHRTLHASLFVSSHHYTLRVKQVWRAQGSNNGFCCDSDDHSRPARKGKVTEAGSR
jgi:hypothetical protein